jgi:hypothetical protein
MFLKMDWIGQQNSHKVVRNIDFLGSNRISGKKYIYYISNFSMIWIELKE